MDNIAVITTKFVLKNNSPILSIYRDIDGDWQFTGSEEVTEKDAMVVSLSTILIHDITVKDIILTLQPGYSAYRTKKNSKWTIHKDG